MEQAIEKLKGAYEELVRVASQAAPASEVHAGLSGMKNAAAYLRVGNTRTKLSYSSLRDLNKLFKQKTVLSVPAVDTRREVYFHPTFVNDYVQDYLDLSVVQRLDTIGERQIDNVAGPASLPTIPEGAAKPVVEPTITSVGNPFAKIAFTSVITTETLYANPNLLDYWIFYATRRLEYELHLKLLGVLVGNARTLTVTSQGLPHPRVMDLLEFMKEDYNARAVEGLDIPRQEAVAAVIPFGYWRARNIQQDAVGQRRRLDLDLSLIYRDAANNTYSIIFGRFDLAVYIFNDIVITFDRVVDESSDKNLYRFTAELHYTGVPRGHGGQGLSVLVTDTAASIAALT